MKILRIYKKILFRELSSVSRANFRRGNKPPGEASLASFRNANSYSATSGVSILVKSAHCLPQAFLAATKNRRVRPETKGTSLSSLMAKHAGGNVRNENHRALRIDLKK